MASAADSIPEVFRTPDERFEDLPGFAFEPNYSEVNGLRMHYVDESPLGGQSGKTILCFHGEPTWSFLYRKMAAAFLEAGHRVVLPDLAGFGRSDKPTDFGWYSYDRHCEQVDGLLAGLDLADTVVVVQDWGGPIGLRWAVENAERVGGLVIMNTGLFSGRVSKGFMAWREFAEKNPDLPVGIVAQGGTATELPAEVVAAYEAPFPNPESKAGAATFPLLVPIDEGNPAAAKMGEVAAELRSWDKPCLVAFSDSDPVFPFPKAGEMFTEAIPTAGEQVKIEGAAHFLQEDRGEKIAEEVLSFLDRS
jgi:haloalkane dehalogenase